MCQNSLMWDQDTWQDLPKFQGLNLQKANETYRAAEKAAMQSRGMRAKLAHARNVSETKRNNMHKKNANFVVFITCMCLSRPVMRRTIFCPSALNKNEKCRKVVKGEKEKFLPITVEVHGHHLRGGCWWGWASTLDIKCIMFLEKEKVVFEVDTEVTVNMLPAKY